METIYIIIGISVISVIVFFVGRRYERVRTEALAAAASEMGMTFYPKGDREVEKPLLSLRLFCRGRHRKFSNMMVGSSGEIRTAVFGYRYDTGSGKNQTSHVQTVFSFESSQLDLPQFQLSPENIFQKIGQLMGYQDIDFPDAPEFSKRFVLRGADESAVRQVFSMDVIRFFESMRGVSVEADGNRLIFYRARRRLKARDIKGFMDEGFRVYALFRK